MFKRCPDALLGKNIMGGFMKHLKASSSLGPGGSVECVHSDTANGTVSHSTTVYLVNLIIESSILF